MGKRKPAEDFSRAGPSEARGKRVNARVSVGEGSGHRAVRFAQMAYRARPIPNAVMALRLKESTVTQTDMHPV